MNKQSCKALLGDVVSFECRQKAYPTKLKKEKAIEKVKTKAKKNSLVTKDILVYDYSVHGILCDSVNCVIEKSTTLVK